MTDREKLEAVAKVYTDLEALRKKQRETTALMIRTCVAHMKSTDSRKRAEAMASLLTLADMLEGK